MPTFLLLVFVLAGRVTLALVRGTADLLLLPARTALALAPHMRHPRPWLVTGVAVSVLLVVMATVLVAGAVR
jgi:hypothetical protein